MDGFVALDRVNIGDYRKKKTWVSDNNSSSIVFLLIYATGSYNLLNLIS